MHKTPYPENILAIILRELQVTPANDDMFEIIGNFKEVLKGIPKVEITMLKLYYSENKSINEISRTTGFPEDVVRDKISGILYKCKTEWKDSILQTKSKERAEKMAAYSKYLQNVNIAEYPLRNYRIPSKAVNALERRNIWGLEQITSLKQLVGMPNIGPKSIDEIIKAMNSVGLSFPEA